MLIYYILFIVYILILIISTLYSCFNYILIGYYKQKFFKCSYNNYKNKSCHIPHIYNEKMKIPKTEDNISDTAYLNAKI